MWGCCVPCACRFNEKFANFGEIRQLLEATQEATKPLFANLKAAEDVSAQADEVWKEVREFEKQPVPSTCEGTLEFLNAQSKVLDQIRTKMQIMQREVCGMSQPARVGLPAAAPRMWAAVCRAPACVIALHLRVPSARVWHWHGPRVRFLILSSVSPACPDR